MRFALVIIATSLVACTPTDPVDLGATCNAARGSQGCAKGNKLAACSGGTWQESMSCPGPKGCYRQKAGHGGSVPLCDEGLARAGNACSDARDVYCSDDRKSRLGCKDGRWYVQTTCTKGCSYNPSGITCD